MDLGTEPCPARQVGLPVERRGDETVEKTLPLSQLAPSHSVVRASSRGVRGKAGVGSTCKWSSPSQEEALDLVCSGTRA